MTTTPTVGNAVPFSNFFTDFSPRVTALRDGTFAIVWQRAGGDIVGRHFNELGSFTGGDFLAPLSASTAKALTDPRLYQQADGQIVVDYNEQFDGSQRDVRWHEVDRVAPNGGSVGMEVLPTVDEFLWDSTNLPEIGSAHVFTADNLVGSKYLILRFADLNGVPSSDRIFLDTDVAKAEQNATVTSNLNGVAVAYEQFDPATFDRQIKLQVIGYNGAPLSAVVPVSGAGANAGFPDITTLSNGSYLVTWQQAGGIAFRNYNGNGIPLDAEPVLIPNSSGLLPKITSLKDGGFIIAWTQIDGTEGDGSPELDIFLQRFDSDGNAIGNRVHLDQPGDQGFFGMSIATLADGRLILTYESETGDATNVTTLNYRILDPRDASISATGGDDNFVSREDGATIFGLDGSDKLTGRGAADVLYGGNGGDTCLGAGGNDYIQGDAGDDLLHGEDGVDRVYGGQGIDTIYGGLGDDFVHAVQGDDLGFGGDGNDTLEGHDGTDVVRGGSGADTVYGGTGVDDLHGDADADVILGGADNDICRGDAGNDRIEGGAGADLMLGGSGADELRFDDSHTGVGAANRDRISDFLRSQGDKLNVELIDANLNAAGDQDFVFRGTGAFTGIGQLRVVTSGTDRIIQGNNDSDMAADFEIVLIGFGTAVQAGDFSDL